LSAGDKKKTKAQLIKILDDLRAKNMELEKLADNYAKEEESEEKEDVLFFSLAEITGKVLLIKDKQITYANGKFASFLGYRQRDIIGLPFSELIPDKDENILADMEVLLNIGKVVTWENVQLVKANGDLFNLHFDVRVINDNGRRKYLLVMKEDEKRQTFKDNLLESEEKYHLLTDQSIICFLIIQDGKIVYVNEAGPELSGYSIEELMRWKRNEIINIVHPKDKEFVAEQSQKKQSGEKNVIPKYDFRIQTKDGNIKWVTIYSKTVNYKGKSAVQGILIDITDRKKAERSLASSESKFRTLVNASADAIVSVNEDEKVVIFNKSAQRMFGIHKDFVVGRKLDLLLPTELRENHRKYIRDFFKYGPTRVGVDRPFETTLRRLDGRTIPIEIAVSGGRSLGEKFLMAVIRDITIQKNFQNALFAERQRLTSLLEMLPASVCLIAKDHSLRFANKQFRENFGELEGDKCYKIMRNRDKPCSYCKTFSVFTEKQFIQWEWEKSDGKIFQFYDYLFSDTEGESLVLKLAIEITGLKEVESKLSKSRRRFKAIVEDQTELICRFIPDGELTFVNDAYCKYMHRTYDQLVGLKWLDFLPEEDREMALRHLKTIDVNNPVMEYERRVINYQGDVFWQRWSDRGIFDEKGNLVEYQSVGIDITTRKLAEEKLKRERAFLNNIIYNNPYAILICDREGYRISANQVYFDLFPKLDYPPKSIFENKIIKASGMMEKLLEVIQGKIVRLEEGIWHQGRSNGLNNKPDKWCLRGTAFPIFDSGNKVNKFVVMYEDITQSKLAEKELRKAFEKAQEADLLKMRFLGKVSHEFRTPLNAINGLSTVLRIKKDLSEEKKKEFLNIIQNCGKSLLMMIEQILDVAKMESGKLTPNFVSFNFHKMMENLFDRYRFQASAKSLKFNFHMDNLIPQTIIAEPLMLERVLNNLIDNAMKFTRKGYININIDLSKVGQGKMMLKFTIKDTGIGISQEQRKRVFSLFYQVDDSPTREHGGTGLGLAITKELVTKMRGDIDLTSEPWKGTTVVFTCVAFPDDSQKGNGF